MYNENDYQLERRRFRCSSLIAIYFPFKNFSISTPYCVLYRWTLIFLSLDPQRSAHECYFIFLLALAGSLSDALIVAFIEFAWYKYLFRDGALDDQPICSTGCYDYFFSSGRKNISHKAKAA